MKRAQGRWERFVGREITGEVAGDGESLGHGIGCGGGHVVPFLHLL